MTDQNSALSAAYGDIFRILKQTHYRKLSVFTIDANITPPIRLGQYHLVYNDRGIPMAYATWAFLSPENIEMMKSGDDRPLHISEWNEGTHLFINDFVALQGRCHQLAKDLISRFYQTHEHFHAVRRNHENNLVRYLRKRIRGYDG